VVNNQTFVMTFPNNLRKLIEFRRRRFGWNWTGSILNIHCCLLLPSFWAPLAPTPWCFLHHCCPLVATGVDGWNQGALMVGLFYSQP